MMNITPIDSPAASDRLLTALGEQLSLAARWARTHDPSEGLLSVLTEALAFFGVEDASLGA